ncbi:hypothetical protein AA313_de0209845 [Arthrobotrys entomopaga]|nr:hypothetical protein AA313_de0209845 [Arthrobotrys entomopaga]
MAAEDSGIIQLFNEITGMNVKSHHVARIVIIMQVYIAAAHMDSAECNDPHKFLKWLNDSYIIPKYINAGMNEIMLKNLEYSSPDEEEPQPPKYNNPNPGFPPGGFGSKTETSLRSGDTIGQQRRTYVKVDPLPKPTNKRTVCTKVPRTPNASTFKTGQRFLSTLCRRLIR